MTAFALSIMHCDKTKMPSRRPDVTERAEHCKKMKGSIEEMKEGEAI